MNLFEPNVDELSLFVKIYQRLDVISPIRVIGMVKLGIGFLHIPVSDMGLDDIHNLMALSIIYVMADVVMSISIGDHCMENEVLGKLHSHMRLSC